MAALSIAPLLHHFRGRNQLERAREALDVAFEYAERDEKMPYSELHRVKGEILLARTNDVHGAETLFEQAISLAQRQQAKLYELRATLSLARLYNAQGKSHKIKAQLATIRAWFTEDLGLPDLKTADELLNKM